VATTQGVRRSELPGWFWGALGCMTVLVVGLAVVFFMGQSASGGPAGTAPAPAAVAPPATAAAVASPPARTSQPSDIRRARGPGIQIEPMAAPPAAIDVPAPAATPRPRAPVRPIKVARSPGASPRTAVATKATAAAEADDTDSQEEELLKPKPRAAAPAADDSDQDEK